MSEKVYRASEKDCFIFVEFAYGDPTNLSYVRYTDMEYNYNLLGVDYISLPNMDITYPKMSGGLTDPPGKIDLPPTAFSLAISGSEPVSEIFVTIKELVAGAHDSVAKVRFAGQAAKSVRNFSGNRKVVRIEILPYKNFWDISMGVSADLQCGWGLGRGACGVNIESLVETGTITSLSSNQISLTGLTSFATLNYFRDGFILKDGVSIKIRDHGNTADLVLTKAPPASWLYQSVSVYPGCDKLLTTCQTKWSQEANFLGLGIGIPDYQPIAETP